MGQTTILVTENTKNNGDGIEPAATGLELLRIAQYTIWTKQKYNHNSYINTIQPGINLEKIRIMNLWYSITLTTKDFMNCIMA